MYLLTVGVILANVSVIEIDSDNALMPDFVLANVSPIDIDDSVIRKKNGSFEYLNRNLIKSIQTPQGFNKNIIMTRI